MFRDVPQDGDPSPTGVRRVDITKTSKSFECPQSVYTPLLEKAIPDTFQEAQPTWLLHLPPRLLEAMRDHQVSSFPQWHFVLLTQVIPTHRRLDRIWARQDFCYCDVQVYKVVADLKHPEKYHGPRVQAA